MVFTKKKLVLIRENRINFFIIYAISESLQFFVSMQFEFDT